MYNIEISSLAKLFILSVAFRTAISIQLDDISETCPGNFITQDYNASWENAAQFTEDVTYFIPFASKLNAFLFTQNLFQIRDFKYLTESHLENSCLTLNKIDGWDLTNVTGFDGKSLPVRLIRTDIPKLFRFVLPYPDGGIAGYASIALSDNESYNLFDYCFDNGLRAFAVLSTSSFLDETTLAVITAHVKSLGFKQSNFIYLNYGSCFDTEGNLAPSTEDLPKPAPPTWHLQSREYYSDNLLYPSPFYYKKK